MANKKTYTVYDCGCDPFEVNDEYVENIDDIENVIRLEKWGDLLKVVYKSGEEVWYQNIHGSWGFPTVFV